jgi:hypothetical protein
LSAASKRQAAIRNLRSLITHLELLFSTQIGYFVPAINDYIRSPTSENWARVAEWSRNVHGLVKIGIRSVVDVEDAPLEIRRMARPIDDVYNILLRRAGMILPILEGPAKTKEEMQEWLQEYDKLVSRLGLKLRELQDDLSRVSR